MIKMKINFEKKKTLRPQKNKKRKEVHLCHLNALFPDKIWASTAVTQPTPPPPQKKSWIHQCLWVLLGNSVPPFLGYFWPPGRGGWDAWTPGTSYPSSSQGSERKSWELGSWHNQSTNLIAAYCLRAVLTYTWPTVFAGGKCQPNIFAGRPCLLGYVNGQCLPDIIFCWALPVWISRITYSKYAVTTWHICWWVGIAWLKTGGQNSGKNLRHVACFPLGLILVGLGSAYVASPQRIP